MLGKEPKALSLSFSTCQVGVGEGHFLDMWDVMVAARWLHAAPTPGHPPPLGNLGLF